MMRTRILPLLACIAALMIASACKNTEEQVLDDMLRLSDEVERNGSNYDFEDWAEVFDEMQLLDDDACHCSFTPRQAKEFRRARRQLQVRMLREGAKTVTRVVGSFFAPFAQSFIEGMIVEASAMAAEADPPGVADDGLAAMPDSVEIKRLIERLQGAIDGFSDLSDDGNE